MASEGETVPKRVKKEVEAFGSSAVTHTKDAEGVFHPTSYAEMWRRAAVIGTALLELGVEHGQHIGIISDNREEWLCTDLAVLGIGAADVPRGSDATKEEIAYILEHADCELAFIENATQMEKLLEVRDRLETLRRVVLYDDDTEARSRGAELNLDVRSFSELRERGEELYAAEPERFEQAVSRGDTDDLATIIYTSGTTGEPKGAMLTHRSFLFQMDRVQNILHLTHRDIFLSVLPIWHSFERAVEYIVLNYGASIAYSKPIGQIMLADMQKIRPTWMTSVPRIWEGVRSAVYRNANKQSAVRQILFHFFVGVGQSFAMLSNMFRGLQPQFRPRSLVVDKVISALPLILLAPLKLLGNVMVFNKLRQRLGGRFVAGVSGGGALPPHVDSFFQAAGITLLEGYGLTETGPILAVRLQEGPVPGTVGPLLPDIEHKVLDEAGNEQPPGHKGVLWVKSEQLMLGYYKKPDATALILQDGWLNTGDLAIFTHAGEFRIIGRAKDTIVLRGGENVEPTPIEEKLVQSEYIDQAMVVGQDQKFLGALVVPNEEKMTEFAEQSNLGYVETEELLEDEEFRDQIKHEIDELVCARNGFKTYEHVYRFALLSKPFEVGRELTNSLKMRRSVIYDLYHRKIEELFR